MYGIHVNDLKNKTKKKRSGRRSLNLFLIFSIHTGSKVYIQAQMYDLKLKVLQCLLSLQQL